MKKIITIGSPGAGKSYFSKQINILLNVPLFHMDNLYWHADKTHITHEELVKKLNDIIDSEQWLIDGNYNSTLELRASNAETIFFFDYPVETCIEGITNRVGEVRTDIPWVEETLDPEFYQFVTDFGEKSKPHILEILEKYPDKSVYRFTSRKETEEFLISCFPKKIAEIARKTGIKLITENHVSGDLVYALGEQYILKVSNVPGRLLREKTVNDYLQGKVPVSETVEYAVENGVEFYLKTCVEGENLIEACLDDPEKLVELLANALKMYHSIDTNGCNFLNPESEGLCFVHGDFCLPNILVKDGKVSGFIDTEASGLGDPWMDYAWAIWSLEFNLQTKDYTPRLLEQLEIEFDEEKFKKYTTI